ncbi:ketopantoate reductase family protein [Chloroflexota bacterium]
MNRNLAVLGTGAIGSSIGADLTKAGHNVLLIDQWPAHVEAMKAHGLHVTMPGEELHTSVQALHLCELCAKRPQLDIVFLAAKSYDTCWMVEFIKPYLKPDGVLVSTQNGLNDEWIAPVIGHQRDIACTFELSAEVFEPGQVKRRTDHTVTKFIVGELHGRITPRLQEVAQILSAVGKTGVSTNIWGVKWTKLVFNTMTLGAVTGTSLEEIISKPESLDLCIKLARETVQVGTALGYTLEPITGLTPDNFLDFTDEAFKKLLLTFVSGVGTKSRSMTTQDILKGRRTESDYINGLVVKKGQEAKVPTPINEAVVSLMRQIEEGKLKPDISNLRILEQAV